MKEGLHHCVTEPCGKSDTVFILCFFVGIIPFKKGGNMGAKKDLPPLLFSETSFKIPDPPDRYCKL